MDTTSEENPYRDVTFAYLGIDDRFPVQPRPYQCEAFCKVVGEFEDGRRSTLLVLPTGTGKTVVFLLLAKYVIEQLRCRVLILAHRGELITQACNAASAVGLRAAVEKADEHARPDLTLGTERLGGAHLEGFFDHEEIDPDSDPQLVVASVQTLQGRRLTAWPKGHFGLIVCDEAHHATADSYRRVIEHFAPDRYLGVTATWDRGDKTPIVGPGQVFESLSFEYPLATAVEQGYLARPWFECLPCDVDLADIRTTGGDYNAGDLEEAIRPHVEELVNVAKPKLEGRRFIVFTPDCGSADAVASAFQCLGVSCESVNGQSKDRDAIIGEFRSGRYRGLCNCALLTEGFDAPFVDAVVLMRPTKSRALFSQMVGRGTRLYPGKTDLLVIGFDWKTFDHRLIHPVELFAGGGVLPELTAIFDELAGDDPCDVHATLKRAREEQERRAKIRVQIEERKRNVRAVRFDPLATRNPIVREPDSANVRLEGLCTEKQANCLINMGYKPAEIDAWTKARATAEIGRLFRRRELGLSSKKQCDFLRRLGFGDATQLTYAQASDEIDRRVGGRKVKTG